MKDSSIERSKDGKKIKSGLILAVISIILIILLIPAIQQYQFQASTNANFSAIPNKDLDDGDLEKIKTEYDKAAEKLKWNGYDLEANLVKADILHRMQEYDKAMTIYKKMQEINPMDSRPLKGLGDVYFSQRKYNGAEDMYVAALKNDAKNVDVYMQLARVYQATGKDKKDISVMKKFYEDGIQSLGDDKVQLVDSYASYLERLGEYAKAIEQVNILLATSPDDEDIKARIAELQAKMATAQAPAVQPAQ